MSIKHFDNQQICVIIWLVCMEAKMNLYTEKQKTQDFEYFKDINKDFFSKNGHKFLAIKNRSVVDNADSVQDLIKQMNDRSIAVGTYLIQECTGDDSAYTTTVMRLITKGQKNG